MTTPYQDLTEIEQVLYRLTAVTVGSEVGEEAMTVLKAILAEAREERDALMAALVAIRDSPEAGDSREIARKAILSLAPVEPEDFVEG